MGYFGIGCSDQSTELAARGGYSAADGFGDVLSKIGSVIKTGAGAALDLYGQQQQQTGQLTAYQQQQAAAAAAAAGGGMPSWVVPAAIGGVGLVAVVLMTGRRKNPARRARRR